MAIIKPSNKGNTSDPTDVSNQNHLLARLRNAQNTQNADAGEQAVQSNVSQNDVPLSTSGIKPKALSKTTLAAMMGAIGFAAGAAIGVVSVFGGVFTPSFKVEDTFLNESATLIKSESKGPFTAHILQNKQNPEDKIAVFSTLNGNIIMGNVLDKKGEPIFNDFIESNIAVEIPVGAEEAGEQAQGSNVMLSAEKGQLLGEYKGEVPELIKFVDGLAGFKEDPSKSAVDTLYVVYDPRCPYCHKFFETTRSLDLKSKGVTIKWLPTLALGDARVGTKDAELAVAGLTLKGGKDDKAFADSFDNIAPDVTVTSEHQTRLEENLRFLLDSSQAQGVTAAVPTAFYLDKKSGQPRMISSPGDVENLKLIFGD